MLVISVQGLHLSVSTVSVWQFLIDWSSEYGSELATLEAAGCHWHYILWCC